MQCYNMSFLELVSDRVQAAVVVSTDGVTSVWVAVSDSYPSRISDYRISLLTGRLQRGVIIVGP